MNFCDECGKEIPLDVEHNGRKIAATMFVYSDGRRDPDLGGLIVRFECADCNRALSTRRRPMSTETREALKAALFPESRTSV